MTKDHININIGHLSRDLDFDHAQAVHSVGLSHLQEYVTVFYSEEVPKDARVKLLTERVLGSLATFSTTGYEALIDASRNKPEKYVPLWLKSFTPVVDNTKDLNRNVDQTLQHHVKVGSSADSITNDLTYEVGLVDAASFVIADQLEIEHPRRQLYKIMNRAQKVTPSDHTFSAPRQPDMLPALDLLLSTDIIPIKAEYKKKITNLRVQGQKIVDGTENNMLQLRTILQNNL